MKTVVKIDPPHYTNEDAREAFDQFCQEHHIECLIHVELEENDPHVSRLLELLASYGLTPMPERSLRKEFSEEEQHRRFFCHSKYRIYDPSDCMECEYVQMQVKREVSETKRLNGVVAMWRSKPTAWMLKAGIASAGAWEEIIVSSEVRAALDVGKFARLRFTEVNHAVAWKAPSWWELDSDLMLPQVSPTMLLVDFHGETIQRGDTNHPSIGIKPRDGIIPALYTYRRSDLESVGPFDVARAFEPYGKRLPQSNALIVSQRFFRKCLELKLDCMWIPVQIEK